MADKTTLDYQLLDRSPRVSERNTLQTVGTVLALLCAVVALTLAGVAYHKSDSATNSATNNPAGTGFAASTSLANGSPISTDHFFNGLVQYSRAQSVLSHPFCQANWKPCSDLLTTVEAIFGASATANSSEDFITAVREGSLSHGVAHVFTALNNTIIHADPFLASFENHVDLIASPNCSAVVSETVCVKVFQQQGGNQTAMVLLFGDFSATRARRGYSWSGSWSGLGRAVGEGAAFGAIVGGTRGAIVGSFAEPGGGTLAGAGMGALDGGIEGGVGGALQYGWDNSHF